MKTKLIKIADIKIDEECYPRSHVDWQTKARYYNAMKSGAVFPPVCVAKLGKELILVDGAHRTSATKDMKEEYISSEVLTGLTKKQIYIEAVKRNVANGRQLSAQEITQVAITLEKWNMSQEKISELVRIPTDSLKPFIARRLTRISETQEDTILKAPFGHLAGGEMSLSDIEQQRIFATSSQTKILAELIRLIENDWLDTKNPQIVRQMEKLKKLLGV